MNQQATNTNGVRGLRDALRCIGEKGASETVPLHRLIDSEARQDHDRNGVWHIAPEASRNTLHRNRSRCQSIVAKHAHTFADDESPRCAADLIGAGTPLEPVVKRRLS